MIQRLAQCSRQIFPSYLPRHKGPDPPRSATCETRNASWIDRYDCIGFQTYPVARRHSTRYPKSQGDQLGSRGLRGSCRVEGFEAVRHDSRFIRVPKCPRIDGMADHARCPHPLTRVPSAGNMLPQELRRKSNSPNVDLSLHMNV